jgi:hypothetical protein
MRKLIAALFLATPLAACGQASNEQFDKQFGDNFRTSCSSTAANAGVPGDIAGKVCDCSLSKVNEKYPGAEKLALSGDDVMPILTECMKGMGLPNG